MPRQQRAASAGGSPGTSRRTWPLPVPPVTTALVLALVLAAAGAWFFEGRHAVPPAEAAKQLVAWLQEQKLI